MNAIVRGVIVYVVLMVVFRFAGKRTLSQATPFDLVLLLIISETIQQALLDNDSSLTHSLLLVLTLVGLAIVFSVAKQRWPAFERWMDDLPVVLVEEGSPQQARMDKERVDEADLLSAARLQQGLRALDEVAYAVLEPSGELSIVPRTGEDDAKAPRHPRKRPSP